MTYFNFNFATDAVYEKLTDQRNFFIPSMSFIRYRHCHGNVFINVTLFSLTHTPYMLNIIVEIQRQSTFFCKLEWEYFREDSEKDSKMTIT